MEIIPPNLRIYQQILKDLENALPFLNVPKAKAGRKPKLTDIHIAAMGAAILSLGERVSEFLLFPSPPIIMGKVFGLEKKKLTR